MVGYSALSLLLLSSIFGLVPIPFPVIIGAMVVWAVFKTFFAGR